MHIPVKSARAGMRVECISYAPSIQSAARDTPNPGDMGAIVKQPKSIGVNSQWVCVKWDRGFVCSVFKRELSKTRSN
jgi:hypothetical protein